MATRVKVKLPRRKRSPAASRSLSKEERKARSYEIGGHALLVFNAKLYFTAFWKACKAQAKGVGYRECWRIGDTFIEEHKDDAPDESALLSPPHPSGGGTFSAFYATPSTQPGDAEKTYNRLMSERFGAISE